MLLLLRSPGGPGRRGHAGGRTSTVRTLRYAIHHSSLREFLHGTQDVTAAGAPVPDPVDDALLRRAVEAAHHRIATYYLTVFGGLRDGLPRLAHGADLAAFDHCYPLRHLPTHLHRAGRYDELRALLTCRRPVRGASLGTLWADAHEQTGTLDDYLATVDLLRGHAERTTDRQLTEGRPAVGLVAETECALLAAVVVSHSLAIPAVLLEALVRSGTWTVARALPYAYRRRRPEERVEWLVGLLPHISDPDSAAQVARDAFAAATAVAEDWDRAKALEQVAPHLDADALRSAAAVAAAITLRQSRARALVAVGSRLTGAARARGPAVLQRHCDLIERLNLGASGGS